MNTQITAVIVGDAALPFETYYKSAKDIFVSNGHFHELTSTTCKGLIWPKNHGVYVVWQIKPTVEVLYIGMTGKFSQAGIMSGPGLNARTVRWTPYCFDMTANTFCFGPNPVNGQNSLKQQQKAGYRHRVSVSDIRIECFEYFTTHRMAPAFLEALLLQGYLMQHGKLPLANNEL